MLARRENAYLSNLLYREKNLLDIIYQYKNENTHENNTRKKQKSWQELRVSTKKIGQRSCAYLSNMFYNS